MGLYTAGMSRIFEGCNEAEFGGFKLTELTRGYDSTGISATEET